MAYLYTMSVNTAIFDMDGLLVDSEPLWHEAAIEVLRQFRISMSEAEYATSIGLRTREFLAHWFGIYRIDPGFLPPTEQAINQLVTEKIKQRGKVLPGVFYILEYFREKQFKIGLATSSPLALVDVVVDKFGLRNHFDAFSSAEHLPLGKPHPQVFLDCADALGSKPQECLCFEDSFNGMIAAKAARMKCVVIPAPHVHHEQRWSAADNKLNSLRDFSDELLKQMTEG